MTRQHLLSEIIRYRTTYNTERNFIPQFVSLLQTKEDCFLRTLMHAHITGSAWILSEQADKVLLMHHHKLDKWLQPGGHADGDENIANVALREAFEETGLTSIKLLNPAIFDLDIHLIPARKNEPAHEHFDVRYLFTADEKEVLKINEESKNLAWVSIEEVANLTNQNSSIMRMVEKTKMLLVNS